MPDATEMDGSPRDITEILALIRAGDDLATEALPLPAVRPRSSGDWSSKPYIQSIR